MRLKPLINSFLLSILFWIFIIWLFSCCASMPTLSTTGKVIQVDGDRALVKFPTLSNKNAGAAWFQLENVNEGDIVNITR